MSVRTLGFAIILLAGLLVPRALADDCQTAARMGMMLGQIDEQCTTVRLTEAGRRVKLRMAALVSAADDPTCLARGKVEMLQDMALYNPRLDELARQGDQKAFSEGLCVAITRYLGLVAGKGSTVLFEKRD